MTPLLSIPMFGKSRALDRDMGPRSHHVLPKRYNVSKLPSRALPFSSDLPRLPAEGGRNRLVKRGWI